MFNEDPTEPMTAARTPRADRGAIQSIERAAHILALFDQDTPILSPALVAERTGLNRTTAHRYLATLQSSGFLNMSFGPGLLLDQLAAISLGRRRLLQLAPAHMNALANATGITVVLSIPGSSGPVVVLVEESPVGAIVLTVRVGTLLGPSTAQARVIAAYQSDAAVVSALHAELSPVERATARDELAKVRREGIAWADIDHLGLSAVAAPILGSRDIHGSIALIGTSALLPSTGESAPVVRALRQAAEDLSGLLRG